MSDAAVQPEPDSEGRSAGLALKGNLRWLAYLLVAVLIFGVLSEGSFAVGAATLVSIHAATTFKASRLDRYRSTAYELMVVAAVAGLTAVAFAFDKGQVRIGLYNIHAFWLVIPHGAIAICNAALARKILVVERAQKWTRNGRCAECGYDLWESHNVCPECGRSIDESVLERRKTIDALDRFARRGTDAVTE